MEGGEHDLPRLAVEVAVDREHPVAEQRDQVAEAAVAPAEAVGVGDEHEVVRLRAEQEDVARVEHAQREHRAVALVGLEQQRERVGDHAVRAPHARRVVARRVAAARPALGLELEHDAPQRVGADRLRARQRHGVNLHSTTWCRDCRDRCLRARARGPGPRRGRGVLRRPARDAGRRALAGPRGDLGDGGRAHADRALAPAGRARRRPGRRARPFRDAHLRGRLRRRRGAAARGGRAGDRARLRDRPRRAMYLTDPDGHVVELGRGTSPGTSPQCPSDDGDPSRAARCAGSAPRWASSSRSSRSRASSGGRCARTPPQLPDTARRAGRARRRDRALRGQHARALGALAPAAARRRRAPGARGLLRADHDRLRGQQRAAGARRRRRARRAARAARGGVAAHGARHDRGGAAARRRRDPRALPRGRLRDPRRGRRRARWSGSRSPAPRWSSASPSRSCWCAATSASTPSSRRCSPPRAAAEPPRRAAGRR